MATFDLHMHSCWSYDAVAPVEYYFREAARRQLRCIAITEHHNIDSRAEIRELAPRYPEVRVIPAAELTVSTAAGGSVDLVCLGFPDVIPEPLAAVLEEYHEWQRACGAAISAGLQAIGCDYSDAHRLALLRTYRPGKAIALQGNTHVQNGVQRRYFVRRGLIAHEEDYRDLLRRAAACVPRPPYPAAAAVIPAVKAAGILVIIAHPTGYFAKNDRRRMDALREELQLDGIECAHDTVPAELTPVYRAYCREHGLLSSAGSDCHAGPAANPEHVGTRHHFAQHIGDDAWLDEILERLGKRGEGKGER